MIRLAAAGLLVLLAVGCGAQHRLPGRTAGEPSTMPSASPTGPSSTPSRAAVLAGPGSAGAFVIVLQLRLGLTADGFYGPLTEAAVRTFQAGHELARTGRVDTATWDLMRVLPSACPAPAPQPITHAPGLGRTVALTFDDGASPTTPAVLAVLSRFGVKATFFDTGAHDTTYPTYVRQLLAAGDVLGNHTYDHPKNWGFRQYFTPAQQTRELVKTSAVQAPLLGHSPCLMRPPGGAWDQTSLALTRALGMSMVLWTVGTSDWQQPPYLSKAFQQRIIAQAEAGTRIAHPIVLLHVGKSSHEPDCRASGCLLGQVSSFRGNTVAALPAIIEFYQVHGYRFVTL